MAGTAAASPQPRMTSALIDDARAAHEARTAAQYASVRRVTATIAIGVTLALVLRSVALEPFNIPSRSMLPTLQVGDYLFVAKWPYGYSRASACPLGPALWDGRIGGHGPERGDVVVFKSPADNRADFIKRVVGLPGDRVRMTGGRLEINGALIPCAPVAAQPVCTETLGGRRYQVADLVSDGPRDDTPVVVRCRPAATSCSATTATTAPTAE